MAPAADRRIPGGEGTEGEAAQGEESMTTERIKWFAYFGADGLYIWAEPWDLRKKYLLLEKVPEDSLLYPKIAALVPGMMEIDFEKGTVTPAGVERE